MKAVLQQMEKLVTEGRSNAEALTLGRDHLPLLVWREGLRNDTEEPEYVHDAL